MAGERVIVVGAGAISNGWFKALKAEKVRVAAVVDIDASAASKQVACHALEAPTSDNLHKTLRQVQADFVLDLTPPQAHCSVVCTALRAGYHVLGEKPMAPTLAQARKMVRTAEQTQRMYMLDQTRRWMATTDQVQRMLASGKIGDLTTVHCDYFMAPHLTGFRTRMASPLLMDMAIHHFDLARAVTGLDAVSVYAREFNPANSWFDGDASAVCIFEMDKGVVFTYRGSWCAEGFSTGWCGTWRFIGTKGTIIFEKEQPPQGQVGSKRRGWLWATRDIKTPARRIRHESLHGALREMLTYLRTGKAPQTQCHDNIKSLAMVFAAMESSRKGKPVPIRV